MISFPAFELVLAILAAIYNIESRDLAGADIRTISGGPNTAIINEICATKIAPENIDCAFEVLVVLETP